MFRDQTKDLPPLEKLISLAGKTALITGAASGIGKAIAYRFAEAGANLILVDIDEPKLAVTCEECSKQQVNVVRYTVDLCSRSEIEQLWTKLDCKEPDILVNNAGMYPMKPFLEVDEAFIQKVMELNLNSVLWMCQSMIKARVKRGGIIVNLASIEAVLPFKEHMAHYSISKAGVIALTRSLASEYGGKGFRVNTLVPGGVMTPGTRDVAKKGLLKLDVGLIQSGLEYKQRLPIGRFAQPDEIARMALVLACDLSNYVNGALIAVDGGFLSA